MKLIIRWAINAAALYAAVAILNPHMVFSSPLGMPGIILLALLFGLVNALFRPLLKFLSCPLIVLTLGLFTLIINTLLFALTAWLGKFVGLTLTIGDPFWWYAFLGALIVRVISFVLNLVLHDELKGRRQRKD